MFAPRERLSPKQSAEYKSTIRARKPSIEIKRGGLSHDDLSHDTAHKSSNVALLQGTASSRQTRPSNDGTSALHTDKDIPTSGTHKKALPKSQSAPIFNHPKPEIIDALPAIKLSDASTDILRQSAQLNPTEFAQVSGVLQQKVATSLHSEIQTHKNTLPVINAQLGSAAEAPIASPKQPLALAQAASNAPALAQVQDTQVQNIAREQPITATPASETKNVQQKLKEQGQQGGFFDWLLDNLKALIHQLPTQDNSLDTHPGAAPLLDISGRANPNQQADQQRQAKTQVLSRQAEVTNAIASHTGQQEIIAPSINIHAQPQSLLKAEQIKQPELAKDSTLAMQYAKAPIPKVVRLACDEELRSKIQPRQAQIKANTAKAHAEQHKKRAATISKAQLQVKNKVEESDKKQKAAVNKGRNEVLNHQRRGMRESNKLKQEFDTQNGAKGQATIREVNTNISELQTNSNKKLKQAQTEAQGVKREKESEAASVKQDLESKRDNDSWWDQATAAIQNAFNRAAEKIDKLFTQMRQLVASIIQRARNIVIEWINNARNAIIEALERFRVWAQQKLTELLAQRFPALLQKIHALIQKVVDFAKKAIHKIAEFIKSAIVLIIQALGKILDTILAAYQFAIRTIVKLVRLLASEGFVGVLLIIIRKACELAGVDPAPILAFFARAGAAVKRILEDPLGFINRLMQAIFYGVKAFSQNIRKHLLSGLIAWLTGAISSLPIELPKVFDFKGIVSLLGQILGVTYDNVKAQIIKRYAPSETLFAMIEKTFGVIRKIKKEGLAGIWQQIQLKVSDLEQQVIEGIRNFVIFTIVKESVTWLLGLINPAGAIVKAVKLLFDLVMFFVERFNQLKDFIGTVYGALAEIVAGNWQMVSKKIEAALARSLPVVLGVLASLAGLGGITKTISNILKKFTRPIKKIINQVVSKVVAFAKKQFKRGKRKVKQVAAKLVAWWKLKKGFKSGNGQTHTLMFKGKEKRAELMIHSKGRPYERFLDDIDATKLKSSERGHYQQARVIAKQIQVKIKEPVMGADKAQKQRNQANKQAEIEQLLIALRDHTKHFLGKVLPEWKKPDYGHKNSADFASEMKISVLARAGEGWKNGSSPKTTKHSVYDILNKRRGKGEKRSSFYIRGHLLNDNLGGPGEWFNMTPLTREANHQHEAQAESYVKAGFMSGAIQSYEVNPVYISRPNHQALQQHLVTADPANAEVYQDILEAEKHVPQKLEIKSKRLSVVNDELDVKKPLPTDFKIAASKDWTIDNDIAQRAGEYFLSSTEQLKPVELNQMRSVSEFDKFHNPALSAHAPFILAAVNERRRQRSEGKSIPKFGTYRTLAEAAVVQGSQTITESLLKQMNSDGYIILR